MAQKWIKGFDEKCLKASDLSIPEPLSHPSTSLHVQRLCVSRVSQSAGSKEKCKTKNVRKEEWADPIGSQRASG